MNAPSLLIGLVFGSAFGGVVVGLLWALHRKSDALKANLGRESRREALAAYAHEAWSGWMAYLFGKSALNADGSVTIPPALVARWKRQAATPYADLPPSEQDSDRAEADKILAILEGRDNA